ncbi:LuxR C-terminal-related transcriptional regulator [Nocardia sp. NPDC059239]|uniref:helix-turn-helix domain-containing protein n=1 Tax=unclassified Nocardia TaxID=2637762 RepID=UPI00368A1FA7
MRDLAFEEAARLYTVALDHTTGGPPADRGRLLLTRATAHFRAGNLEPARADCLAAGELARRTGDANLLAERALILDPVGNHLWDRDIHEWCIEALTAEALLGDGYQADKTTAEPGGSDPALAAGAGSLFGAVDFDARSMALCPSGRLPESLRARLLARATEAASYLGRWDEIGETSSRALALADRCGDAETLVAALRARQLGLRPYRDRHVVSGAGNAHYFGPVPLWLGKFAAALGDSAAAERELRTALEICRDTGAQGFVVEASTDLAAVLLERGATEEALALAKAALPQAESIGMPPWTDRLRSIAAEASARAVLSPREREVAQLVAAGLSNREIATALVLSERTAQNHVQHILTKLGFTNRAQIVAWVNHADRGRGEQGGSRPR